MTAYYNEIDPQAAQWLRNLIAGGHIAPGDVDERSITDVRPSDLRGYTQCHFFAGVGVWSLALRRAGWPDDRPVWTGSCPCQPFSSAGKRGGFDDERHLWPHFHWLISQRRPPVTFGEQVSSKAVEPWIDLVQADVEALEYAFGCIAFPSAGVGAPHIRDRAFWVADSSDEGSQGWISGRADSRWEAQHGHPGRGGSVVGLADSALQRIDGSGNPGPSRRTEHSVSGSVERLAYSDSKRRRETRVCRVSGGQTERTECGIRHRDPGPTNGFWRDADWLFCRDGKWRPVEPGTFPLVDGAASRVVRLRAYGNAINAEAAQAFIESWLEAKAETRPVDLDDLI